MLHGWIANDRLVAAAGGAMTIRAGGVGALSISEFAAVSLAARQGFVLARQG
jgi:hypothetical protein